MTLLDLKSFSKYRSIFSVSIKVSNPQRLTVGTHKPNIHLKKPKKKIPPLILVFQKKKESQIDL